MGDIADMYDELPWEVQMRTATCKVCKKKGLEWEMTPAGWRLFDGTQLHECFDAFQIVSDLNNHIRETKGGK